MAKSDRKYKTGDIIRYSRERYPLAKKYTENWEERGYALLDDLDNSDHWCVYQYIPDDAEDFASLDRDWPVMYLSLGNILTIDKEMTRKYSELRSEIIDIKQEVINVVTKRLGKIKTGFFEHPIEEAFRRINNVKLRNIILEERKRYANWRNTTKGEEENGKEKDNDEGVEKETVSG